MSGGQVWDVATTVLLTGKIPPAWAGSAKPVQKVALRVGIFVLRLALVTALVLLCAVVGGLS